MARHRWTIPSRACTSRIPTGSTCRSFLKDDRGGTRRARRRMERQAMLQKMMTVAAVGCAVLVGSFSTMAAEIRVTSSNALKTSLEVLAPGFEKETGHKLVFTWGAGAPLKVAIEKGASF